MQVEVTESNIDKFDLVNRFGNSREFLLNEAANAAAKGMVLSVELPDDVVLEQNVFEVFEGEHVDPRRLRGCGYEKKQDVDGVEHWVCVLHGKTSRYDVSADSHVPCIQVDPEVRPSEAEFNDALSKMDKTCVYNKIDDPNEGTVYICAVHGKTSKHDITRLPNLPCKAVDPEHH